MKNLKKKEQEFIDIDEASVALKKKGYDTFTIFANRKTKKAGIHSNGVSSALALSLIEKAIEVAEGQRKGTVIEA